MTRTPSATDAALYRTRGRGRLRAYLSTSVNCCRQAILLGRHGPDQLVALTLQYYVSNPRARVRHGIGETGLCHWEEAVLEAYFSRSQRILVTAAGDGREVQALARRGKEAIGLEPCAALVAEAQARLGGSGSLIYRSPPSGLPQDLMESSFDAAMVGWGGYTHMPGSRSRIRFLETLRQLLPSGAPLLLSFLLRSESVRRYRLIQQLGNLVRRAKRLPDDIETGDTLDGSFDHLFTENEVARELAGAGFERIHFAARPYGHAVAVAV